MKMQATAQEIAQTAQPDCMLPDGHLNIYPILDIAKKLDCPFIAFIGEKRIGKTYGPIDYGLQEFYKHGYPMFYIRRHKETFTENICGNLVNKHRQTIINLSKGGHNGADLRGKYFDLVRNEEQSTGNIIKRNRKHFMYCRGLQSIESETADDKGQISCILYDEFLTRGCELKDEFNKLMIAHANATGKRTHVFTPMFLAGNTVSRESDTAAAFGIELRNLKRGLNIITNTKGEARIILYYVPPTEKGAESGRTYYDRFENSHINMIAHGDWTLGTYNIANQYCLAEKGFSLLCTHNKLAVKVKIITEGIQPRVVIQRPDHIIDMRVSSGLSKTAINFLPANIIKLITSGYLVAETPEIGENFRDICKHLTNGAAVVNYFE